MRHAAWLAVTWVLGAAACAPTELDLGRTPGRPSLVRIPSGTFLMGSPPEEEGRTSSEGPQRRVTISSDFLLAF